MTDPGPVCGAEAHEPCHTSDGRAHAARRVDAHDVLILADRADRGRRVNLPRGPLREQVILELLRRGHTAEFAAEATGTTGRAVQRVKARHQEAS